jgi:hypothetical protein
MKTERKKPNAVLTKKILSEIQTALLWLGAGTFEVAKISLMTHDELYDLAKKVDADPYLLGYIGSWGDTHEDEEILLGLARWNLMNNPE